MDAGDFKKTVECIESEMTSVRFQNKPLAWFFEYLNHQRRPCSATKWRKGRPAGHRPPRLSLIRAPGRGRGSGHLCAISGGLQGGIRAQNLVDTRCTRRGEVRGGACRGRFRSRSGHGLQMARAARPHARRRRAAEHAGAGLTHVRTEKSLL